MILFCKIQMDTKDIEQTKKYNYHIALFDDF